MIHSAFEIKRWRTKQIFVTVNLKFKIKTYFYVRGATAFPPVNTHEIQNITYEIYQQCTLLLYFGTRAYLFSPDKGSWYVFPTGNNCCEFLASYYVIILSVTQSFLKMPVCGASLTWIQELFGSPYNWQWFFTWGKK